MGLIFKDADEKPVDPKTARLRAVLFALPFALIGILALVFLAHDGLLGFLNRQKAMGLASAAIVCGGIILLIFGVTAKKQAMLSAAPKTDTEKPWLARKDWAGGQIGTSSRKAVLLLWITIAFWCAASVAISLAILPPQLRQGNRSALMVLIFPVIGAALMLFALKTTTAWRKFNRVMFVMSPFPAGLGDALAGEVRVPCRLRPLHGYYLRLSCVRRTMSGASNNRRATEKVLWEADKWLRADLPQSHNTHTAVPVFFKLPSQLPASSALPGDGIHWKLETSAKLSGPQFHAVFETPVFNITQTEGDPLPEICPRLSGDYPLGAYDRLVQVARASTSPSRITSSRTRRTATVRTRTGASE